MTGIRIKYSIAKCQDTLWGQTEEGWFNYLDTDGNLKSNLDAETLEDHPLALLPFRSATR